VCRHIAYPAVPGEPLALMDLRQALRESISYVCEIPVERIQDTSDLGELGFDSLASAEVITDLEIRLGQDLPVDALRRVGKARTVGDVAALLTAEFGQQSHPEP
jgi:acyl carrier protein